MPTYKVTDPTTGRTLKLTGGAPPTEQELEEIFKQSSPAEAPEQESLSWGEAAAKAPLALATAPFRAVGKLASGAAAAGRAAIGGLQKMDDYTADKLGGMRFAETLAPPLKLAPDYRESAEALAEGASRPGETASAVWKAYKDRYGTEEGWKNLLANEPEDLAMDVSGLFYGGAGAARMAGAAGAASKLKTVANAVNPIVGPAKVVGKGASAAAEAMKPAVASGAEKMYQGAVKWGYTPQAKKTRVQATPDLMRAQITSSDKGMARMDDRVNALIDNIGDVLESKGVDVPVDPIIKRLEGRIAQVGAGYNADQVDSIQGIIEKIRAAAPNGTMSPRVAQQWKKELYAASKKQFIPGQSSADDVLAGAEADASLGFKEAIESVAPEVKPLNAELGSYLAANRAMTSTNQGVAGASSIPTAPGEFFKMLHGREVRQWGANKLRKWATKEGPQPLADVPETTPPVESVPAGAGMQTLPKNTPTPGQIKAGNAKLYRGTAMGTRDTPGGVTYTTTDRSFAETFLEGNAPEFNKAGGATQVAEVAAPRNVWDFRHAGDMKKLADSGMVEAQDLARIQRGDWGTIERHLDAIKSLGYDGFTEVESGALNVGIFNKAAAAPKPAPAPPAPAPPAAPAAPPAPAAPAKPTSSVAELPPTVASAEFTPDMIPEGAEVEVTVYRSKNGEPVKVKRPARQVYEEAMNDIAALKKSLENYV